ncbi:hypothetical protein [Aerosakkonema funiforme]|uniref:hypothetical protein n=1 Tax=Aerosakkonema funiforme TaxID=1246630 RepID=UPI0016894698|nr:hypothetical protein [Aerosakkonema funiforme]
MDKNAQLNIQERLVSQKVSIIPSGESVLAELGIEQTTLKLIRHLQKLPKPF